MFGIGGTELIVIAVVLLIAVGPNRLPTMLKAAVKGYREFRRATRELRASTGIDQLLQDEDLRDLRKPLDIPLGKDVGVPAPKKAPAPWAAKKGVLGHGEKLREAPPEGVDVAEIRDALHRPSPEEAARIVARKEAALQAKVASSGLPVDPEEKRRVIEAKLAAARAPAPLPDDEESRAIIEAKLAAARAQAPVDDEESRRIIEAKLAAAGAQEPVDDEESRRIIEAKLAAARAQAPDAEDEA